MTSHDSIRLNNLATRYCQSAFWVKVTMKVQHCNIAYIAQIALYCEAHENRRPGYNPAVKPATNTNAGL